MDDIQLAKMTMKQLTMKLSELIDMVTEQQPAFVGFNIERITKKDEDKIIRDGIKSLDVKLLDKWHHQQVLFNAWKSFYKDDNYSTKFVDRMPGLVVVTQNQKAITQLVVEINQLKDEFAYIIRHGRNTHEKHEFIHSLFPQIMTEHVYRHIGIVNEPITNAWFNWTSRPAPKTLSNADAISYLENQYEKPRGLFTTIEWDAIINNCISEVRKGAFEKIQIYKAYRVLPTVELQYLDGEQKKRIKKNAIIPLILLSQPENALPKISRLKNYVVGTKQQSKTPKLGGKKVMIDKNFNLIGVLK